MQTTTYSIPARYAPIRPQRDGKRFDQHGMEMYRMNAEGQIAEFWALMRDTAAFDEFFA